MKPRTRTGDLYKALLQVNEIAISESTSEAVFGGMCKALKKLVPFDRAGLTLYDPENDGLRITALHGRYETSFFHVGDVLDRNASQNGWTFEHQCTTIRRNLPKDLQFDSEAQTAREGFRSLCSVPLVVRRISIGVVTVVGVRKNQFSVRHSEAIRQMCNQITLAISSLLRYCTTHPNTKLFCPSCIGSAGGRTTVSKHRADLSNWGRKGGRGRKKQISPNITIE